MLCELLVQRARRLREIPSEYRKPFDRFMDEIQLPTPDRLDAIEGEPTCLHHGLSVLVVACKHHLDFSSGELEPADRTVRDHKLALLGASVCHVSSHDDSRQQFWQMRRRDRRPRSFIP
jgi:hypothetical protein